MAGVFAPPIDAFDEVGLTTLNNFMANLNNTLRNINYQNMKGKIPESDTIQLVDNVDATHKLKLKIYVDDSVAEVKKVNLAFSLENFWSYGTGAASGGSSSPTTSSGGSATPTSASDGDHRHKMFVYQEFGEITSIIAPFYAASVLGPQALSIAPGS